MSTAFIEAIEPPDGWENLRYHPLSELTEFNSHIDLEGMIRDMQNEGYDASKPIVLFGPKNDILGGRHRHQGAVRAEVVPTFARFIGKDPMKFIQRELRRQHLDESQRALVAASLLNVAHGGDRSKPSIDGMTTAKAAETMNVGTATVERAKKVLEKGSDKLKEAVKSGNLKVSAAASVVNESPAVQDALAASSGPARCTSCKKKGTPIPNCPACIEAQAKADKPKKKGKGKSAPKTVVQRPLDWKWFDKSIAELNRFFLELKCKDKAKREDLHRRLGTFTNACRVFCFEENPKQ